MSLQRAAEIQAVLEGVELPARRAELEREAAQQDPCAAADLARISHREQQERWSVSAAAPRDTT